MSLFFFVAFEALQACLEDIQCVHVVRQGLVADLLELYKDQNVASKTLDVTFEGEPGVDCNGLTRDLLTSFWRDILKDLFRGEDCSVPYLPLYRVRNESWKLECLGRILSHTVALTGTIPSTLARSTLVKLITDSEIDDECLLEDFHTCFNHLEVPMTYDNIQEFTREFKCVLDPDILHITQELPRK